MKHAEFLLSSLSNYLSYNIINSNSSRECVKVHDLLSYLLASHLKEKEPENFHL